MTGQIGETPAKKLKPTTSPGAVALLMLIWSTAGFCMVWLVRVLVPLIVQDADAHPVLVALQQEYWAALLSIGITISVPVLTIIGVAVYLLRRGKPRRSRRERTKSAEEEYSEEQAPKIRSAVPPYTRQSYAGIPVFLSMFLLQLIIMAGILVALDPSEATWAVEMDLASMRTGAYEVYEGKIQAEYGRLGGSDYMVETEGGYYRLRCGDAQLRCPTGYYDGSLVIDSYYKVEYLEHTGMVVEIYDAQGNRITGEDGPANYTIPDNYWLHDGFLVRRRDDIYGYDQLNTSEQMAFDLFYGMYYAEKVVAEGGTNSFQLPEALNDAEYERVQKFYQANTAYDGIPAFRYDTDGRGSIKKVYAGGYAGASEGKSQRYLAKGDEIISAMPEGLSDVEKCAYIAMYLVNNVRYESSSAAGRDITPDNSITVLQSKSENKTGYGALINGHANCTGYMQAFDMLARKAGLTVVPVSGMAGDAAHAWNMVKIDGSWYHIDTTWMDGSGGVDYTYFLADDAQIASTHQPGTYWTCDFVELPHAMGMEHNWFYKNGQIFGSAQEALDWLNAQNPGQQDILQVRLDDMAERPTLINRVNAGEAGSLTVYSGSSETYVLRFVRNDFLPPPTKADYDGMRAQVPYGGLRETGSDLSRIPVFFEGDATAEIQQHLTDLLGGHMVVNNWHFDAESYPEQNFILYAAARRTQTVAWEEGTGYPYYEALARFGEEALFNAKYGILEEHLEATARALFGDGIEIEHGTIPSHPLAGGEGWYTLWEYDSLLGAYIPVEDAVQLHNDLVVLEYTEADGAIDAVVVQLWYDAEGDGYSAQNGETISAQSTLLLDYAQSETHYRARLRRTADGALQLVSFGLDGRDYSGGTDGGINALW